MNTNEAILNKLIELGYAFEQKNYSYSYAADGRNYSRNDFHCIINGDDFCLVQRALFDECGKRDLGLRVKNNVMTITEKTKERVLPDIFLNSFVVNYIHKGDTSRESFVAAFEKVVGVSCE